MANTASPKKEIMEEKKSVFKTLYPINVNDHTEKKNGLTYLSWAWAWAEVKEKFPDAVYEIEKFDGIPYAYDPRTGYMVYTKVTIEGITHEMWLPVMDSNNMAMKAEPYKVTTAYGKEKIIKAATMFDVNKTIMRCLVKNLAMFGLGLYIYAGEDLPEDVSEEKVPDKKEEKKVEVKPTFKCANCGKEFNDEVTAKKSMERWGKYICIGCIKKKQAEIKKQMEMKEVRDSSSGEEIQLPFEIV